MSEFTIQVSSRLETCPPDILRYITALLLGPDVMALFLCGAPKLSARLFNDGVSSLQFDWTHPRYRIWYPFVMKFRRLERLSITATYERFFSRFEMSPHFRTLYELELTVTSKTANTLWLETIDPEIRGTPLNLGKATPFLKTLILRQCSVSHTFVTLLPPTLRTLEIRVHSRYASDAYCVNEDTIAALPRELEHLTLLPLISSSKESIAALPPTLKSIRPVAEFDESTFGLWPQSATLVVGNTLSLSVEAIAQLPPFIQQIVTQYGSTDLHIPDHVTLLHLKSRSPALSLPSKLTSLTLSDSYIWRMNDMLELPKTLKYLEMRNMGPGFTPAFIKSLPNLRSLSLQRIESFEDEWIVEGLPETLTHLDLNPHHKLSDEAFKLLPRGLRSISLSRHAKISNQGVANLPESLTSLKLFSATHLTGECFKGLPRGLTELVLSKASQVENYHLSHLPRWLTYLRLESPVKITEDGFKMLPRRLKTLTFAGEVPKFSPSRVSELPPSITQLYALSNESFEQAFRTARPAKLDTDEREEIESPIIIPKKTQSAGHTSSSTSLSIFTSTFWKNIFTSSSSSSPQPSSSNQVNSKK